MAFIYRYSPDFKRCPQMDISSINVVAIQNFGSSGSLLLQSLLDSHPNFLMTPALQSRDFFSFWKEHGHGSINEVTARFLTAHESWFQNNGGAVWGLDQLGAEMKESAAVPFQPFVNALTTLLIEALDSPQPGSPRRTFFIATYLAYSAVLQRQIQDPIYIVFPIHSLPDEDARCLLEDFPDTRFIYTVRDPLKCIASGVNHILHYELPVNPLECSFAQILNNYSKHWGNGYWVKGDRPYFEGLQDSCRAVRLEDLHSRPRETMQAICRWLGVPWHECLMESTFNGKKWWNRPESPRLSGFSSKLADRKSSHLLNSFDRMRVYAAINKKCSAWGYARPAVSKNLVGQLLMLLAFPFPFRAEFFLLRHGNILAKRRQVLRQKILENIEKGVQRLVKLLMQPMGWFVSALVTLYLILSDYSLIRWWLYRAFLREELPKERREVKLLQDGDAGAPPELNVHSKKA